MNKKEMTARAEEMGKAAYEAGLKRVPAMDPKLDLIIPEAITLECLSPLLRAWLKGWDRANLEKHSGIIPTPPKINFPPQSEANKKAVKAMLVYDGTKKPTYNYDIRMNAQQLDLIERALTAFPSTERDEFNDDLREVLISMIKKAKEINIPELLHSFVM